MGSLSFIAGAIMMVVSQAGKSDIVLPRPDTTGGKPLMQVLKERKSSREFDAKALPPQVLSNLLWAAFGVNRPDGKRTAPSANNKQEIDIYAALANGLFKYDAKANKLVLVSSEDIRAASGEQPFVATAPANLIYVATIQDPSKWDQADQHDMTFADGGFIAENVYLFCASEGLATVIRGWVDRAKLGKAMKLGDNQKVLLAQTVGYPKSK